VSASRTDHPPNLVWDWSVAALGAVYALPAAVVALSDRQNGIALATRVPMFGVGLSYPDIGKAAEIASLMVLGSAFACAVSMLRPERPPTRRDPPPQATHRSRWYVTSAFTTFLVFLLLLYSDPQTATKRFNERVLETLLGVGIAYFYGLALPALAPRRRE
jgi:hypothetical protein